MEGKILSKYVENGVEYYLTQFKGHKMSIRLSKTELLNFNKNLYEEYETKNRQIKSFI